MAPPAHQHLATTGFQSWIPLLVCLTLLLVYLLGRIKLKARRQRWSDWRTLGFVLGICLLEVALQPALMHGAHGDLKGHMVQHLLIGMFVPIFLVLGAPITLAIKTLPTRPARRLTALLKSSFFQVVSHPVTGLLLNIGGMYVLYLTPLYSQSFSKPWLHPVMHLHFLLVGYLFTWSIIGPDPVPGRPGLRLRLLVLFFSIAAHAILSKVMYSYLFPLHSPHPAAQIREAAQLMYYWGDLSELLLTIAFFRLCYTKRKSAAHKLFPVSSD